MTNEQRALRLHNYAAMADALGHPATAEIAYRRSLAIDPNNAAAEAALGLLAGARGDDDEAIYRAAKAIGQDSNCAWAWTVLGRSRTIRREFERAEEAFASAFQADPTMPERSFDIAAAVMRKGDYARGWPLHTAANRADPFETWTPPPLDRWDGETDDRLLAIGRLGFGDQIMFSRFLPWAASKAKRVTVLCLPSQAALYSAYERQGICEVVTDANVRQFDAYIETFALPELAGCTPETIPPMARTRDIPSGPLRVGIAWSGSDRTVTNAIRRVPFETMLRLAENPSVRLFSIQTGDRAADVGNAHAQTLVKDLSGDIAWDWALTSAALQQIDLVVSSDCGLAHLAGAMGVPTFLMLSAYADWRWGPRGSKTTPWYPSMRLFWQDRIGDWTPVIEAVKEAISVKGTIAEATKD